MRRLFLVLFLTAFSLTALAQQSKQRGVYVEDINPDVAPCEDFFEYSNGRWRAENPIPPTMVRWSRRWEAGELAKDHLRDILDDISSRHDWPRGSVEQLIADHYASCMDEDRIEKLGLTPIEPLLKDIDAIQDAAGLQATIARFHQAAVFAPFRLVGFSDNHDPNEVVAHIFAAGLGMPDRDYYLLPEERFQEARDKYIEHVANMFRLAGHDGKAAAAAAGTVFAMESALAQASLDRVSLRNPRNTDNKRTFAQLQKLTPRFDWAAYFDRGNLPRADLNVTQPKFMEEVDRQLAETPLADWKTYLKWHLLRNAADSLPRGFVRESFEFYQRYLGGAQEMKPRWKLCVESTDSMLGEALGQKYVERHFPPAAKARMEDMVKNLLLAMEDTIRGLDWMGPETRKKALEKLSTFHTKIGYPDQWKDYSSVAVRRDAFMQNVLAAARFNLRDNWQTIGKPVDRGRWGMTPPTSNAYYNARLNEIVFPAGILQPPAFSLDFTDAMNYGAIGVVIGHEISHGFDDQGSQFDAQGRLKNWWTEDDLARFRERGQCVVDQFDGYAIEPGIYHRGKLVLGESIGDLAGAKIAYLGLQKALGGKPGPVVDGFTSDQQFFLGWGQFRGDALRPETQRLMVQNGPHPTGKYRVIGPLSNMPQFHRAFQCKPQDPMVRPKEKQCEVW